MFDAIKPLLDSGLINEDVSREINEAWENKLSEAREQVRVELREEFAQRYEHDKSVMVDALDRMVTEGLTGELEAIAVEKQQLAEDRVKFQAKMTENATKFNDFLVKKLAEEIAEVRRQSRTRKIRNFCCSCSCRRDHGICTRQTKGCRNPSASSSRCPCQA